MNKNFKGQNINNEAERAAPTLSPCPFCGAEGDSIDPEGWYKGDGTHGPACDECGATAENNDAWNRRTTAPASADVALPPLDAEGLPPIPKAKCLLPGVYAYTFEQVRQAQREAIAPYAERIRLLEKTAEVQAAALESRKKIDALKQKYAPAHTIDTPEFRELNRAHREAFNAHATLSGSKEVREAWGNLIAYIDGRTAAAPSRSPAEDDK